MTNILNMENTSTLPFGDVEPQNDNIAFNIPHPPLIREGWLKHLQDGSLLVKNTEIFAAKTPRTTIIDNGSSEGGIYPGPIVNGYSFNPKVKQYHKNLFIAAIDALKVELGLTDESMDSYGYLSHTGFLNHPHHECILIVVGFRKFLVIPTGIIKEIPFSL